MDATFTPEIKAKADAITARYEVRRAAMLEILHLMQTEYGHISLETEKAVADYIGVPPVDVREVITFYTLYYTKPRAKTRFNVCRTLPCMLAGGDKVLKCFEEKLGIKPGQCTADNEYSLQTVECLGACELAPMLQLNDEAFVGWLTPEKALELIRSRTAPKDAEPVGPVHG